MELEYHVDRNFQGQFCDCLEKISILEYSYGVYSRNYDRIELNDVWANAPIRGVTNGKFIVRPYKEDVCNCGFDGNPDSCEECEAANFEHISTGLKIMWYKYPLRGATSNIPVTKELLQEIFSK